MTCSTEDLRAISKCMNELKQIITDDVRTAKATKAYVNQKTEEIMQLITQMKNEMQNEVQKMRKMRNEMQEMQKMQDKLTKEEGKSAELQSAVHALNKLSRTKTTSNNEPR
jgi:gas vesicle protein